MFDDPDLNRFYEFYLQLRGDETVAHRTNFNPMALPKLLPNLALYECRGDDLVYRLAGTAHVDRLGHDPVERSLSNYMPKQQFEWLRDVAMTMIAEPCGVHIVYENQFSDGRILALQALGFPFRTNSDRPPQIVVLHTGHRLIGYRKGSSSTQLASRVSQACYVPLKSDPVPHLDISSVHVMQDIAAD